MSEINHGKAKVRLVFDLESYQGEEGRDTAKNIFSFVDRLKVVADDLGYKVVKGSAQQTHPRARRGWR